MTRLMLGEELIHAAHLVVLRGQWFEAGRMGDFGDFVKQSNRGVFDDIRATMESLPMGERIRLQGVLSAVYHTYYSRFGDEVDISPGKIFEKIEGSGRTVEFIAEFLRQAIQQKRQGEIREAAVSTLLAKLGQWVREALQRIRQILPEAFDGAYGKKTQATLSQIEAELDSIEGKPPKRVRDIPLPAADDQADYFSSRGLNPNGKRNSRGTVNPSASPYRDKAGELILERPINATKDPISAETEARFLRLVNDPQTADRIYDSLPDAYGGKVINPDTSREILPEYRDRQGRMENTVATGGVASVYARDRFWREITNPRGRKKLVLMAGGPGAGKSTFVDQALGQEADLIFDGTLRDAKWAKQSIDLALEHGWQVSIQYVQRPMEDVFYGIVTRAHVTGRWFPIRNLAQAQIDAQKSVLKLSEIYKASKEVRFSYLVGPTDKIDAVHLSEIDFEGKWHYYETYAEQRGEALERKSVRDRPGQLEKGTLVRENQERLRRVIQERRIEERLLLYLARGDEGLLRLIGEVYGHE